ncbi:MAG: hypothetical protein M3O46_13650 [Myxococcota bacterium]|nr:hypothetical protein [Myxococcota bacterium]
MTPARQPARPRTHALALLSSLAIALALESACMETRRSLGEDCLKNDDCLSDVCSQLHCAASPSVIDAQVTRPDAGDDDIDAPAEATTRVQAGDALVDTAVDTFAELAPDALMNGDGTGD